MFSGWSFVKHNTAFVWLWNCECFLRNWATWKVAVFTPLEIFGIRLHDSLLMHGAQPFRTGIALREAHVQGCLSRTPKRLLDMAARPIRLDLLRTICDELKLNLKLILTERLKWQCLLTQRLGKLTNRCFLFEARRLFGLRETLFRLEGSLFLNSFKA